MNRQEYFQESAKFLKRYEDFALERGTVSLNHGTAGLLLYYCQKFRETADSSLIGKIKILIKTCLQNLAQDIEETSFFLGPTGVVWSLILAQRVTGGKFSNEDRVSLFLNDYFNEQRKVLDSEGGVLDYIYGVGGWFVLFPYLSNELKNQIMSIYSTQLEKFDGKRIGKIEFESGNRVFKYHSDLLGFSHGLSSIISLAHEYKFEEKFSSIIKQAIEKVSRGTKADVALARYAGGDDFLRQDWCHGILGKLMFVESNLRDKIIRFYLSQEISKKDHGICHGLGQNIILSKISESTNYQSIVNFPEMDFNINLMTSNFLQSPLICEMSLRYEHIRDKDFSWWRMIYPYNI